MSDADMPVWDGRRASPCFTLDEYYGTPKLIPQADQRPIYKNRNNNDAPDYLGQLTYSMRWAANTNLLVDKGATNEGGGLTGYGAFGPYAGASYWDITLTYAKLNLANSMPDGAYLPARIAAGYYSGAVASGNLFLSGPSWDFVNGTCYLFRDLDKIWNIAVQIDFGASSCSLSYSAVYYLSGQRTDPRGTYNTFGNNPEYPTGRNGGNALEVFNHTLLPTKWRTKTPPYTAIDFGGNPTIGRVGLLNPSLTIS